MSIIESSRLASSNNNLDMTPIDNDDEDSKDQRRTYEFNKLKHYLLTSNAEQRAAKRKEQDYIRRKLIDQYLEAVANSDSDELQEIKKRFKTYCNSYEDLMNSNWAACG